jgi:hypothetical protein
LVAGRAAKLTIGRTDEKARQKGVGMQNTHIGVQRSHSPSKLRVNNQRPYECKSEMVAFAAGY